MPYEYYDHDRRERGWYDEDGRWHPTPHPDAYHDPQE